MKKRTIITLIFLLFSCLFTGCSAKIYEKRDIKKEGYTVNNDLTYVTFIVPNRYESKKIKEDELVYKENSGKEYENGVFYFVFNFSSAKYVKDNEFFLQVSKIDSNSNISEITCATDTTKMLPSDLGIEISNPKDNSEPSIEKSDKKSRVVVKANIKKTLEGNNYNSYIGLIRDEKRDMSYAIIVGYKDNSHDKEAKEIAENLYFVKQ